MFSFALKQVLQGDSNVSHLHVCIKEPRLSLSLCLRLHTGINGTSDILTSVRDTTQELQSQSDALNSSLSNVAASISALVTDCNNTVGCNSIPSPETFTPGADFNQVSAVICAVYMYMYNLYLMHEATT